MGFLAIVSSCCYGIKSWIGGLYWRGRWDSSEKVQEKVQDFLKNCLFRNDLDFPSPISYNPIRTYEPVFLSLSINP